MKRAFTQFEEKFSTEYPQWFWEAVCTYYAEEVNILSVKYGMYHQPSVQDLNNSSQRYLLGFTLIDYIVTTWGEEKLSALIKSYVKLESVLGVNMNEFERGWHEHLKANY